MSSPPVRSHRIFFTLVLLLGVIGLQSCESSSSPSTNSGTSVAANHAVLVLSEGKFQANNSTLGAVLFEDSSGRKDTLVEHGLVNGMGEGNDVLVLGDRAYVLDYAGAQIVVLRADSLSRIATIPLGLTQPNKMAAIDATHLLVTRRGAASAAIVDLGVNAVTDSIPIGEGSIGVAVAHGKAFISSQSYAETAHLNIVDLSTKTITRQLEVLTSPEAVLNDSANNEILVGSTGDYSTTTPRLYWVNASTGAMLDSLNVGDIAANMGIVANGKEFLLLGQDVYPLDPATHQLGAKLFSTPLASGYYQGAYDATRDDLYLGRGSSYSAPDSVDVFSAAGVRKWSFLAGIAPAHFAFYH